MIGGDSKAFSILQLRRLPVSSSILVESSSELVQATKSSSSVLCIDLSASMDLALMVIATKAQESSLTGEVRITETQISLYRILSWEKVFSLQSSDIAVSNSSSGAAISGGPPTIVRFHNYNNSASSSVDMEGDDAEEVAQKSSKFAAIGFADGRIAVLDIETSNLIFSVTCETSTSQLGVLISSLAWVAIPSASSKAEEELSVVLMNVWRMHGGIDQVRRHGMVVPTLADPVDSSLSAQGGFSNQFGQSKGSSQDENTGTSSYLSILSALSSWLLLTVSDRQGGMLHGYICGIYPLFSIPLLTSVLLKNPTQDLVFPTSSDIVVLSESGESSSAAVIVGLHSLYSSRQSLNNTSYRFTPTWTQLYKWFEQSGFTQLLIESSLSKLQELVISCSRKWKEACKAVLLKLSLLQSLLESYQVAMTPVQFMYTVSMCGMWHPIASTCFSQHWNDQGLARLKSAVDSASQAIITALQMRAIPYCTNIILASRELLTLHESVIPAATGAIPIDQLKKYHQLVHSAELLLYKLDDTILEARLAREAMLLYIQFVKDCSLEASATANTQAKPDLSLRTKFFRLFDPRISRAENSGPTAQAEHVTGTHLYAYLSATDAPIPDGLLKSAKQQQVYWMSAGLIPHDPEHVQALQDIQETADRLALEERVLSLRLRDGSSSSKADSTTFLRDMERGFESKSFLSQIKATKEVFQSVFGYLHSQQSEALHESQSQSLPAVPHGVRSDSFHRISSVSFLSHGAGAVGVKESCSSATDCLEFDVVAANNAHMESMKCSCLASAYVLAPPPPPPSPSSSSSKHANSYVAILLESTGTDSVTHHYLASFPTSVLQTLVTGQPTTQYPDGPAKICFYSRGVETSKSFSLLLCAPIHSTATTIAEDATEEDYYYYLFRLELSGGLFTELTHTSTTTTTTTAAAGLRFQDIEAADITKTAATLESLSSRIRFRRLDSLPYRPDDGDMGLLRAQGERGIAIVCDAKNRMLILDLETDDDDDEEEDGDEDTEEEEEGGLAECYSADYGTDVAEGIFVECNSSDGDQDFKDCAEY